MLHLDWKGYYRYNSVNVNSYTSETSGVYKLSVKLKNKNPPILENGLKNRPEHSRRGDFLVE